MKANHYTLFIAIMVCFISGGALRASIDLTSGLVAHYPFDGNASDMSGNGHDGIVTGVTLVTDRFGITGKAYDFDGNEDFITLSSPEGIAKEVSTISFWVQSKDDTPHAVISFANDSSGLINSGIFLGNDRTNTLSDELITLVRKNDDNWLNQSREFPKWDIIGYTAEDRSITSDNFWHHVVVVFPGTQDRTKIYLDGSSKEISIATNPLGLNMVDTGKFAGRNPITHGFIGRRVEGGQFYDEANFLLDDVRIYNRALSAADVTALYELERPIDLTSGLVAHYPFDGNANDASGNGNHGTVNGATLGEDRHGVPDKAYNFDGVDDWIDLGDRQEFDGRDAQTISLWISVSTKGSAGGALKRPILSKWYSSTAPSRNAFLIGAGEAFIEWQTSSDSSYTYKSFTNDYQLNKYYHAVFIFNQGNRFVHLDGKLENSDTFESTSISNSPEKLMVGNWFQTYDSSYKTFHGSIDDIRIYNRALSKADVAGLYELERPKDSDSDGLYDAYETYLGTDPNVADTDGDGLNDGQEVTAGTNPKISDKTAFDAVKMNSANFGLAPLSNVTATGATPHTNSWYYQPEWGWVWTNANTFPYVYRSSLGGKQAGWLYFREGSAPPYFHDYATGTWTKLGE